MNKYIIIFAFLSYFLVGCDDFLDTKEQDKIIPSKIEHLEEFLLGEVIQKKNDPVPYLKFMTDDVEDSTPISYKTDKTIEYWGYYTWRVKPEIQKNNDILKDNAWGIYYHDIFICNVIIDQIKSVQGDVNRKNNLKGQALFMRSLAYFNLVNIYGEPYVESTASSALGVPINDETGILNLKYERNSVKQVYDKIINDLLVALDLVKGYDSFDDITKPNSVTINLLLGRVYLYQKKYSESLKYTNNALSYEKYREYPLYNHKRNKHYLTVDNPEIIFCSGKDKFDLRDPNKSYAYYTVSKDLVKLFVENDLRYDVFYNKVVSPHFSKRSNYNIYGKIIRLSELYLNKAEALFYNSENGWVEAIDVINENIRKFKFKEGSNYKLVPTSKDEAIELIRNERRIELCFEDHRWFDLRRYNVSISHKYGPQNALVEYVIEPNSTLYTLPIPISIIENNNKIIQIKRLLPIIK